MATGTSRRPRDVVDDAAQLVLRRVLAALARVDPYVLLL
jgi:hypothetical protein